MNTRQRKARRKAKVSRACARLFQGLTRADKRLGTTLAERFDAQGQNVQHPTRGMGGLKPYKASGWENAANKRGGIAHDRPGESDRWKLHLSRAQKTYLGRGT